MLVLRPSQEMVARFVRYVLLCQKFINEVNASTYGTRMPRASWDFIGSRRIPVPEPPVQNLIADFLDRETARIDQLIEKKQKLLELLGEKRDALCSQAVTCGLDPNAEFRTTGSAFVPLIPMHWSLPRLKQLATVRGGITLGRKLPLGVLTIKAPYLRVANVQAGWVDLSDIATIDVVPRELEQYSLQQGDVLMNEGGDNDKLGRGAVWDARIQPCLHQNHVFSVRPKTVELSEWIVLSTNAKHGREFFFLNSRQSTNLASVAKSKVEQLPIPLPPDPERQLIIEFVRSKVKLIKEVEQKIELVVNRFREFRSALITGAVTGQIDVDTWRRRGDTERRLEGIEEEMQA